MGVETGLKRSRKLADIRRAEVGPAVPIDFSYTEKDRLMVQGRVGARSHRLRGAGIVVSHFSYKAMNFRNQTAHGNIFETTAVTRARRRR